MTKEYFKGTPEQFNINYSVGASVSYIEKQTGNIKHTITRWPAEYLEDTKRPVIWLAGEINAIDLSDIIIL